MLDTKGEIKTRILSALRDGRENAITGKELATRAGSPMSDDRYIRQVIRELIAEGYPIASVTSAPAGYFMAVTRVESNNYMDQLLMRLKKDATRRRDFKLAARATLQPEQIVMEL